jgi:hypothetical protein
MSPAYSVNEIINILHNSIPYIYEGLKYVALWFRANKMVVNISKNQKNYLPRQRQNHWMTDSQHGFRDDDQIFELGRFHNHK